MYQICINNILKFSSFLTEETGSPLQLLACCVLANSRCFICDLRITYKHSAGEVMVLGERFAVNESVSVVSFLLGDSPASEFYVPTFRNTVPSS
jgi:hypothetical protein